MGLLTGLIGNWKLLAGLAVAVSLALAYHALTVSSLESDLAAKKTALATCQANVTKLQAATALQNAAVSRMGEEGQAGQDRAETAASEALRRASEARGRERDRDTGPEAMNAFFAEVLE